MQKKEGNVLETQLQSWRSASSCGFGDRKGIDLKKSLGMEAGVFCSRQGCQMGRADLQVDLQTPVGFWGVRDLHPAWGPEKAAR